ncbi:MAG: rhodanese-like domain-containing protein [Sulfurimonas sp.]
MNKLFTFLTVTSLSVSAMSYDTLQAKKFDKFYSHMTQKNLADSKLSVSAENVMKMFREEKDFVLLDIRTPGEVSIISTVTPNTLQIPLENLFQEKNLNKLPSDKPIIILCHSGARELLAAAGLKQLGFKNIQIVKGGIAALAVANSVKNAPLK